VIDEETRSAETITQAENQVSTVERDGFVGEAGGAERVSSQLTGVCTALQGVT
jgi:hypothetical protein